jgi:hypothetical protein
VSPSASLPLGVAVRSSVARGRAGEISTVATGALFETTTAAEPSSPSSSPSLGVTSTIQLSPLVVRSASTS